MMADTHYTVKLMMADTHYTTVKLMMADTLYSQTYDGRHIIQSNL